MRKVNGIKIKGLTRKQVKELKKHGFYASYYNPAGFEAEQLDAGMDEVLSVALSTADHAKLDDMVNRDVNEIFMAIIKETYGAKDEEKNLPTSGDGKQTQNE